MIYFRYIFNALALVTITVFWSLVATLVAPFAGKGSIFARIARIWAKMVIAACGVRVTIEGLDQKLDAPSYLVMANHTSHFDVISLCASLPIDMRPVAKRELGFIPIFGWVLVLGAAIMIDRGDRGKAIASIERAGRAIRDGRSVLMFPEGTRTPPGVLGPLKKGPFHLAIAARVPILPVGVVGTGQVLLPGDWRIHPGPVTITVGAPIPTAEVPDDEAARGALLGRVEDALGAAMKLDRRGGHT